MPAAVEYTAAYAQNTNQKLRADALDVDWANSMTGAASTDVA